MATFGASGEQADHVDRAMAAAIGLVGANEALNRRCASDWGFRLEVGVGIASGPVVIGAVGSAERSELGVLGDAVNVAARLVTNAGPGEVLMTGTVYRAVATMLQSELTNQSAVRGRSGSLEIYRMALIGGRGEKLRSPETPPISTPRPPWPFSRSLAPTWGAIRPATSLIGASSGSLPSAVCTVS